MDHTAVRRAYIREMELLLRNLSSLEIVSMLMKLLWFSRAEDRLDDWVTRQHQNVSLTGKLRLSAPVLNEAFLEGVARQSKQIALSDPRVDHAANCPACMRQLLELRSQHQSRRRRLVFTAAVVVVS